MSLRERLKSLAGEVGMAACGFAAADPFPEVKSDLEEARASGRAGGLGFTFSDPDTATDVASSIPWAKSLVVAAVTYLPAAGDPGPPAAGTGRIARFATEDHYAQLRLGLRRIADELEAAGHRTAILCDDNRLVDRAAAVRAGIAWWGKSTMVLAPGVGPWLLLGSVVTDAELSSDTPMIRDCGTCNACIPACPTGAIVGPGVLDTRRCLAAVTQSKGWVPEELRSAMGDRFYGCDDCLTACPPGERLAIRSTRPRGRVDLVELLATADRPLRRRFPHFFVPRNQGRFLRRNAIVALGNSGRAEHLGVMAGLLGHPDPMLRAHAAWALGAIGDSRARSVLQAAREGEDAAEVSHEIDASLGTLA